MYFSTQAIEETMVKMTPNRDLLEPNLRMAEVAIKLLGVLRFPHGTKNPRAHDFHERIAAGVAPKVR